MIKPLNANPDFEADTSGWFSDGVTAFARSTVRAHSGTASAMITPDGVTEFPTIWSDEVPVAPGAVIGWLGWIWMTSVFDWQIGIQWNDVDHNFIGQSVASSAAGPAAAWYLVASFATAPAGAAFAQIEIKGNETPPAQPVWVDQVMMYYYQSSDAVGVTSNGGIRYPLPGSSPAGDVATEREAFDIDAVFTTVDAAERAAQQRPRAAIYTVSGSQSLTKGAIVPITAFDTKLYDNAGMVNLPSVQGLTIKKAGIYFLRAQYDLSDHGDIGSGGGRVAVSVLIYVNGNNIVNAKSYPYPGASDQYPYATSMQALNVNDVVTVRGYWFGAPSGPYTGFSFYLEAFMFNTNP